MEAMKLKIKKNDNVMVIAGKHKDKSGKVMRVVRKKDGAAVVIEKLNVVKRHSRPSQKNPQGGIIEKEAPIDISNVMIICPKCKGPVRVGRKTVAGDKLVRACRKCGEVLDK